jgi:hypothetical protein
VIAVDVAKDGKPAWLVIHVRPRKRKGRKEVTVKAKRRPPVIASDTQVGPDVELDRGDVRLRDGTRLTNELAEAITEDVRRTAGRPPSQSKRHGTGKDPASHS